MLAVQLRLIWLDDAVVAVSPLGTEGTVVQDDVPGTTLKDSEEPTEVLLAIKGLAPALAADTYLPLAVASSPMFPFSASTSVNVCHGPSAGWSAIRLLAPAFSAVT